MKTLNIPLEDKEHEALSKVKGNKTWREFLLNLIDIKNREDENVNSKRV